MKLCKIKKIRGYKSFIDFGWHDFHNSLEFHKKINIIFGENGSGKSSIVNLLKSVSGLMELGKVKPEEAWLIFKDSNAINTRLLNNGWDNHVDNSKIEFFDSKFVGDNVHLGDKRAADSKGQGQKSAKLLISLDKDANDYIKVWEDAKSRLAGRKDDLKKFKAKNRGILENFKLSAKEERLYNDFEGKDQDEIGRIVVKLGSEKNEIAKKLSILRCPAEIAAIREIRLESKQPKFSNFQVYNKIFDLDVLESIKITSLDYFTSKLIEHKSFYKKGIKLFDKNAKFCPLCQNLDSRNRVSEITSLYDSIFDKECRELKKEFKTVKRTLLNELQKIKDTISSLDLDNIFDSLEEIDKRFPILKIYSVEEKIQFKQAEDMLSTRTSIDNMRVLLEELEATEKESVGNAHQRVRNQYLEIINLRKSILCYVDEKNKIIRDFKAKIAALNLNQEILKSCSKIEEIKYVLIFLNSGKLFLRREQEQKRKQLASQESIIGITQYVIKSALKRYYDYCKENLFDDAIKNMQTYFSSFALGLKLEPDTSLDQRAADISLSFRILDENDGDRERDFEEGISEGERQVLSICFFFGLLDTKDNNCEKILVFDDPITSLDNANLERLADLINEKKDCFSQIFIFTHHSTFFEFLRKRLPRHSEYNLIRNFNQLGGSFLCLSKNEKSFEKELIGFTSNIQAMAVKNSININLEVVRHGQYLRYEIEKYIKNDLLYWDEREFKSIIAGVKSNQHISDNSLDNILRVYNFCNYTTEHVNTLPIPGRSELVKNIQIFFDAKR